MDNGQLIMENWVDARLRVLGELEECPNGQKSYKSISKSNKFMWCSKKWRLTTKSRKLITA